MERFGQRQHALELARIEVVFVGLEHAPAEFVQRDPRVAERTWILDRLQHAAVDVHRVVGLYQPPEHVGKLEVGGLGFRCIGVPVPDEGELLQGRPIVTDLRQADADQVRSRRAKLAPRRTVPGGEV